MLTQNTLDKIVYEYQHGGVKSNHPELTTYERKALLKHLFSLPTYCTLCEQGHTHAQACRVDNVSPIGYNSDIQLNKNQSVSLANNPKGEPSK